MNRSNGWLNWVLVPAIACGLTVLALWTLTRSAGPELGASGWVEGDVLDVGYDSGQFVGFLEAVRSLGLDSELEGEGPYTIFAPRNHAWRAISDEVLADPVLLETVVRHHIVEADVLLEHIRTNETFTTMNGSGIHVDMTTAIATADNAELTSKNLLAGNGRIHVIDQVLLPPYSVREDN